jgi:hypothetical protein
MSLYCMPFCCVFWGPKNDLEKCLKGQNNIVLIVIMPNVVIWHVIMLHVIMLNVIMLHVIMLHVIMLHVIMLHAILPCALGATE